ncbi:MAG: 3-oxoacyl-ACP reductase FabG [Spirochaetaceae bacterium]|nr:MAG: 3-oxoacyl-ACP reductase FabG [Spirochaetaceae bacterium]
MDLHLKGKTALVTGGSQGLGAAVCRALAAEGARVAVNYRRNAHIAEELVAEITAACGVEAMTVEGSVADKNQVARMFDEVEERFSTVDILVNNAAACPSSYVKDTSEEDWEQTLRTNLSGTFFTCQEMVRRLLHLEKSGRIVNVSSAAAYLGSSSGRAHYDASKGGIISFTVSLAREVAQAGIAVNAVAPGLMITKMTAERFEANRDKYLGTIPLRRFGEIEEVADVIVFLASDRASYMTGTTVNVSGGLLMG